MRTHLRTLLGLTALAGVGAWCLADDTRSRSFAVLGFGLAAGVPGWVGARHLPAPHRRWYPGVLGVAVLAELWAAETAYHTLGEIAAGSVGMAALLNLGSLPLMLGGYRRTAYAWVGMVFLLVVPYQMVLMDRWTRVDREARAIVAYVERQKVATGAVPADLAGYRFADPSVRPFILYETDPLHEPDPRQGYYVSYHVGTKGTSHDYRPATGWFYYPD